MLSLFRILTFESWTTLMYEAMEVYPWAWVYFVSFIIIAAFVFFNLFVAVIIGEMQKLQEADMKQELHEDHEKIDQLLKEVQELKELIRQQKS
jgi:voltage-gated sodium channel